SSETAAFPNHRCYLSALLYPASLTASLKRHWSLHPCSISLSLFWNRQLEHPHFMEVPLIHPEVLYLRDVIDRLNALRGRGVASLYSWSCKS
ncbi:Protein SOSEKI 3, partial [Stylosanthes scabra]|nr:Protein SOSEKI 3 [Stylosanthes scabra]